MGIKKIKSILCLGSALAITLGLLLPINAYASQRFTGDVNGDGKVEFIDYFMLEKYLQGKPFNISKVNADINHYGKIDTADLLALREMI